MYANPRLNVLSRRLFYSLKRDYGGPIDIYKNLGTTVNTQTGAKTLSKDVTPISRAIILPAKVTRQAVQSTPEKVANRAFDQGGFYDTSARTFIVDRRDAPNLNLTGDDWIVYAGCKYQIVNFERLEFATAWAITATQLLGDPFEQIFQVSAESDVALQGGATP